MTVNPASAVAVTVAVIVTVAILASVAVVATYCVLVPVSAVLAVDVVFFCLYRCPSSSLKAVVVDVVLLFTQSQIRPKPCMLTVAVQPLWV